MFAFFFINYYLKCVCSFFLSSIDVDLTDNNRATNKHLNNGHSANHLIIKNINRNTSLSTNQKLLNEQHEQPQHIQPLKQISNYMLFNNGTNGASANGSSNSHVIQMINQHQPNASSYAAIAHAAAAAAASYNTYNTQSTRKMSYNNPSFYEQNVFSTVILLYF